MKILLLDTSTEKAIVSFIDGSKVLLDIPISGLGASKTLFPSIQTGFMQLGMRSTDLEAIAVGLGPGSFTGIRIAYSAAKGLALPRKLPIVGFCSLAGFVSNSSGKFLSVIDARIGGAYVLLQKRHGKEIIELGKPEFVSKENLISMANGLPLVGPSFSHLGLSGIETGPSSEHLAKIVMRKIEFREIGHLEILYFREGDWASKD